MVLRALCRVSAVAGVAAMTATVVVDEPVQYSELWKGFKADFGKSYSSGEHERFECFKANIDYINAENAKQLSYQLGVTQFADLANMEFASAHHGHRNPGRLWGSSPHLGVFTHDGRELPDSVDWRSKGAVTPVKNQGQCGVCWTFSSNGAVEGAWQQATGQLNSLSNQQLLDCDTTNHGCDGGAVQLAFSFQAETKVCKEDDYPFIGKASGKCLTKACEYPAIPYGGVIGYKLVQRDREHLMAAVSVQPGVSVAIEGTGKAFQFYTGGVFDERCGKDTDHAVLVIGYGTEGGKDYWLVKNSWGESWGEQGYVRLLRGASGTGECGILSDPSFPVVDGSKSTNSTRPPPGNWTSHVEENNWVKILSTLAVGAEMPQPGENEVAWHNFMIKVGTVPLIVAMLGLVECIFTLGRMICCRPKYRPSMGKPTVKRALCLTFFALALVVVGALIQVGSGLASFDIMGEQIDLFTASTKDVVATATHLNNTANRLNDDVEGIVKYCPKELGNMLKVDAKLKPVRSALAVFGAQVADLQNRSEKLLPIVETAGREYHETISPLLQICFTVPTMIVILACLGILFSVLASRLCFGPTLTRIADCLVIRCSGPFLILAVLVVTAASVAQGFLAISTAVMCQHPDQTILDFVDYNYLGHIEGRLATYYIAGTGQNPLLEQLALGRKELAEVGNNITDWSDVLASLCIGWDPNVFINDLHAADKGLDECEKYVSPQKVYPFYKAIVHDYLCDTVIAGFSWLVLVQVIVGLCVLPALSEAASIFFTSWAGWQDCHPVGNRRHSHNSAQGVEIRSPIM